jgi:hypothetical protein
MRLIGFRERDDAGQPAREGSFKGRSLYLFVCVQDRRFCLVLDWSRHLRLWAGQVRAALLPKI